MSKLVPDADARQFYAARSTCPCCQRAVSGSETVMASSPPAEAMTPSEHSKFVSGYGSGRVFFTYTRCSECGAYFCPVYYNQAQLDALYGLQPENMGEVPISARQRTQQRYADLIMKYSRADGGFLEIGADIGLFAESCAKAANFEQMSLIEPNSSVHSEIHARLAGRPHTLFADLSEMAPQKSISTTAMIHVLDHLLDPTEILAELRELLEPDAVMLTVTHNAGSLLARVLGRRWPPYALQHPQLYTPQSITRLFERSGFKVVEIADAVNYFPVAHLLRAGFSVLGLPAPQSGLPTSIMPIKLGNMAVVVRKSGS